MGAGLIPTPGNQGGAWRQNLLDRYAGQLGELGQAALGGQIQSTGYQRGHILDEVFVGQPAVLADPVTRDGALHQSDVAQRMQAGGELVRLIRLALDRDHESALAIDGGADGGNAAGDCLIDILLAGKMRGGALGVAEFHGACLEVEFAVDKLAERLGSAGEYRVAERIEPRLVRPEFVSLCVFHALAGDDDAVAELNDDFLDLGQKLILIESGFPASK